MTLKNSRFLSSLRSPPCPPKNDLKNSSTTGSKNDLFFDLILSHILHPKITIKKSLFLNSSNISPSYLEYIIRSGSK